MSAGYAIFNINVTNPENYKVFDYNSAFKKASDVSKSYKKPGE